MFALIILCCDRKVPQAEYEHNTGAPHKFWQMDQTIGGPELTVSPMPSLRDPYIIPNEIGTDRPMSITPGGKRFIPTNVNYALGHQNNVIGANNNVATNTNVRYSGNSTIGSMNSESSSYLLQTPFATSFNAGNRNSVNNNNSAVSEYKPSKQRSHSAPPRTGSSVANLLQHSNMQNTIGTSYMAHTSSSRKKTSGSDAGSVSTANTTRSNMSSSRNTNSVNTGGMSANRASKVSMSLADFINPGPSSSGGTPFDTHHSSGGNSRNYSLRRPIGEQYTGAVAESISGYRA
jgi:hypothetical protein